MLQRVAVVGAGAAGLCAARHLLARRDRFAPPVVFELGDDIGGTWKYDDTGGTSHSSMYRDLRTNLPKEVMMFPDFPFDPRLGSFLPHRRVQEYLQQYCSHHRIQPHIRFNTVVEKVRPVATETRTTWEVTSSGPLGCRETETFDAVFVCSGHYSDPYIPDIPGIDYFKGEVLHSHSYRHAEPFTGRAVVVLGAKASGLDISIELAKAGAQVTLSHGRPRLTFPLPAGIKQCSSVEAVEEDGRIRFQDGSVGCPDVLLLCTGYRFSFPFLQACVLGLQVEAQLVAPLHRLLLPPAFPSLFFIGICKIICPFPHFNCQVQFALSVLDGSVVLPPAAEMEEEARRLLQEKEERGVPRRHLLILDADQWDYCDALAAAAGFTPLPPVTRSLYEETWRQRQIHPENYRSLNYRLINNSQWELIDRSELID